MTALTWFGPRMPSCTAAIDGRSSKKSSRVLSKGGQFIFTDPMQREDCPAEVLQPILDRIHLDSLGSIPRYREMLSDLGFEELDVVDLTPNLTTHYARVLDEVRANQWDLLKVCGAEYIERMQTGLQHWVDGGRARPSPVGDSPLPEGRNG